MAFRPAKLLPIVTSIVYDNAYWNDPINPGVWEGFPYRWNIIGSVTTQLHSSDRTREPFTYNALDIKVGDWITDISGRALKIIEIINSDTSEIEFVAEDVDRYNTFTDPFVSGFGGLSSQECFIFELSEDGQATLAGLPSGFMSNEAVASLENRFFYRNVTSEFVQVYQTNNGLVIGDFITVDLDNTGGYKLVSAQDINMAVGVVNSIGIPGDDWFTYKPLTEIVNDIDPPLVGNYGDIFYLDPLNPGKVTNVKPEANPKPVYIRLESDNRAVRLNAIVDESSETISVEVPVTALDQTTFVLPTAAKTVQVMSINGIENKNFTFDAVSKVVTFDPIATGYGVEESDEVIFVYNT